MLFLSVRPTLFLVQSRFLSGRHVSGFLDSVLGAMMKQVCWHSRRSKAYRGLPEARMAGATVEETSFEDVNMWQVPPPSLAVHFSTARSVELENRGNLRKNMASV